MSSSVVNARGASAALLKKPGFFRVGQLVPNDQDVLTVAVGATVRQALNLMREHNFDQLPVTTADGRVIGTFTYRSLAHGLRRLPTQADVLRTPVDDVVEELQFVRATQDVSGVLHQLEVDHAVLVGDEDRLDAVVTTADVSRFLWERTRPFVLLQDIELAIRDEALDVLREYAVDNDRPLALRDDSAPALHSKLLALASNPGKGGPCGTCLDCTGPHGGHEDCRHPA